MDEKTKSLMQIRNSIRENNQQKYDVNSKKKLQAGVEKKIRTTMIGAIARFETAFGHLWGHGKQSLTPQELAMKQIWEETRTEILNNGNNQLRAANDELLQYNVSWSRYQTNFIIKE